MRTRFCLGDTLWLGEAEGVVVEGAPASGGSVQFERGGSTIDGTAFKARSPDAALPDAQIWLVQEVIDGSPQPRYALMVDDAYWGLRVQPAEFAEAPFSETFVMGYRLRGRVLRSGVPVSQANVSLEAHLTTCEDGEVVLWDSEEYNELVYSSELDTWVEGPNVLCLIRTDQQGEWEHIVPKGHGAAYQRRGDLRDDSPQTAERPLSRHIDRIYAMYRGQRALAEEGSVAVINLESSELTITATPGAYVKLGTVDDTGATYAVPPSGELVISELPSCEHTIVQFKRTLGGNWDSTWGCARRLVKLEAEATTAVEMPPMEEYPLESDEVAGRVYERAGIPAAGIEIVAIDVETCEIVGTVATTNGEGFWSAEIPENGFGGDLYVHDPYWGSVPVLGSPYSDIVLGARAYSSWFDEFRPEAWRKGDFGHKNFPYVPDSVWVEDPASGRVFSTREVEYGGWITTEALPKCAYIPDIEELVDLGPQVRTYDIADASGILESGFMLGSQPFEDWETGPGTYRASGYYPEAKFLLGGKVHGNVLLHGDSRIGEGEPEAARFGLEFGEHRPLVEIRCGPSGGGCDITSFAGFICPYCGGPSWRDPAPGAAEQGYCKQCGAAFGHLKAMDCRTHFRSPTVAQEGRLSQRVIVPARDELLPRGVRYHWRPDVYDENDAFVTQSGPGQPTNAPRWFAKHVDAFGDGTGFGKFDGDATPEYVPGHDISYFSALPVIDRDLGLVQLKLVFEAGYEVPAGFTVDIDCVLETGELETRRVVIGAGLRGPCSEHVFGDAVRVSEVAKMKAELAPSPYVGAGFYRGVADIRLVEPASAPGCRFTVVADVPFLASPMGVPVSPRISTPVALQVDRPWGNPHLTCDAVGQVFLAYTDDGDICLRRGGGLCDSWSSAETVTADGISDHAWVEKDPRGTLILARQRGHTLTRVEVSRNDGQDLGG